MLSKLIGKRTGEGLIRACFAVVVVLVVVSAGVGPISVRTVRGAPGAPTPIGSCRTIDSPGTYALTGDVVTDGNSCISITASGVVFDGNQHAITGNGSGVGISVEGSPSSPITNVTVENVTTTDWGRGIGYEDASGGTVRRTIVGGSHTGISITSSNGVRVLNSTVTSNEYGIYLNATHDSEVTGDIARLNSWGVVLEGGSTRNTISRTISTDNSQWDLHSQADSDTNRVVGLDVGSGTFSLSSTAVRARGTHTGENVFRSPPAAPQGSNGTGNYIEVDPVGVDSIEHLTVSYTGRAAPSSLSLWRNDGQSWSKLRTTTDTDANTASAGPVGNGTIGLFANAGTSIGSRTLARRSDTDRLNTSRNPQIVLRQGGKCHPLSALGNGTQPVNDFYGYRTPYTNPNNSKGWYQAYGRGANRLERANTSQVFLYRGSGGLSLVFLHDGRSSNDASGGTVTADIAGLPQSGNWTVQDDHYHQQDDVWAVAPGRSRAHIEWVWNYGNRSDGGAFVGLGSSDWQRITIGMAFNERSVRYPFPEWNGPPEANHVDRWIARSGTGRTYELNMNRSATLERGSCSATETTQPTQSAQSATRTTSAASATSTTRETETSAQHSAAPSTDRSATTRPTDSASTPSTATNGGRFSEPISQVSSAIGTSGGELVGLGALVVVLLLLSLALFRR